MSPLPHFLVRVRYVCEAELVIRAVNLSRAETLAEAIFANTGGDQFEVTQRELLDIEVTPILEQIPNESTTL